MAKFKNPLTNYPPPQYVLGPIGGEQLWKYRGIEIRLNPYSNRWEAEFETLTSGDPTDPIEDHVEVGVTAQEALGNARFKIDLVLQGHTWERAEIAISHALDYFVDNSAEPIDRAAIARQIELLHRVPDKTYPLSKQQYDAFMSLSLNDRLKLIEEVIDYQKRAGMFESLRRRSARFKNDGAHTKKLKNKLMR